MTLPTASASAAAAMLLVIGVALGARTAMLARSSIDRALDRPPSGPEPSVTR